MAPQLNIGDIIVVQDGTTFNTLKVNDTIVFHHPAIPSKVVVHRVYEILEEDGQRKIVTKGLRNPLPDPWKVTEREYVGKVIFTIPKLGYLNTLIQPPLNFTLVAFFIIIIILLEVYSTSEEE
jgi:signal peptidase